MIVRQGENQSMTLKGLSVTGVGFNVVATAASVNTSPAAADIFWQAINLNVTLKRNGQQKTIANNNLQVYGFASALFRGYKEFVTGVNIVPAATSVAGVQLFTVEVNFGGIINLKDDDELIVQVVSAPSTFGASIAPASSYIEFNTVEDIGYEYQTPSIVAEVIKTNDNRYVAQLPGIHVSSCILNLDQATLQNNIISSLTVKSDRYSKTYTFYDVVRRHLQQYGFQASNAGAATLMGAFPQSFILSVEQMKNVTIDASLNSANVNASKNYVVYWVAETSKWLVDRANAMAKKHYAENVSAIK